MTDKNPLDYERQRKPGAPWWVPWVLALAVVALWFGLALRDWLD